MRTRILLLLLALSVLLTACGGNPSGEVGDPAPEPNPVAPEPEIADRSPELGPGAPEPEIAEPSPGQDDMTDSSPNVKDEPPAAAPETDRNRAVNANPVVETPSGIAVQVQSSGFITVPEELYVDITNGGGEAYSIGRHCTIDHLSGNAWDRVPQNVAVNDDLIIIPPGDTYTLRVSTEAEEGYAYANGTYRINLDGGLHVEWVLG